MRPDSLEPTLRRCVRPLAALLLAGACSTATAADPLQPFIDQALASNLSLAAQQGQLESRLQALREARAQRLPQLAFSARYSVADGGRTIDFPVGDLLNPVYGTLNQLTAGSPNPTQFPTIDNQSVPLLREKEQDTRLSLTAPLYAPQLDAAIAARGALADAEEASLEAVARTLVRDLRQSAYALAQAQAGTGILDTSLRTLTENVRVSQSLVDAGKATRDRVLRAEAERLAVEQRLDASRTQQQQAQRYLNFLRGAPLEEPVDLATLGEALAAQPASACAEAGCMRPRPELRQIDRALEASEAQRRAARAGFLPTLALAADYGIQGEEYRFERDADFSLASLVASWTLFDFGQRRAALRAAEAEQASLRANRDQLARQLDLARIAAQEDLQTALRAIDSAQARQAASEEGFRIAERKRAAGSLSQIEFLDAERALTDARLSLVIARYGALARAAELEYATASYALPAEFTHVSSRE